MDIRVDKASDVPVHEQVAAQLVLLIGTGGMKAGSLLPSVRALAQRLGVHRNTISRAYHDVTLNRLVQKRTGARLVVLTSEPDVASNANDLDAVLLKTIAEARKLGYSLREVHERLSSRLLTAPPDRLLVVSADAGMRTLLPRELTEQLECRADVCSLDEIVITPQRALGAVVVCPPAQVRTIRAALAAGHPIVTITYTPPEAQVRQIRDLRTPSLIAVISVSKYFLEMTRAVLAPAIGRRHTLQSVMVTGKRLDIPRAADVIVCDTLTYPIIRSRSRTALVIAYRLIDRACLDQIRMLLHRKGGKRTTRT